MIEVSASQIAKAQRLLDHIPGAAPKAVSRAINRAAATGRTKAAQKVRQTYYIAHKEVISNIMIQPSNSHTLEAQISSRGYALPLTRFNVTPKQPAPKRKRPILVRVKRGGGGPVTGAFVARLKSGSNTGVFKRVGKARTPTEEFFGPPLQEMLNNPTVVSTIEQESKSMFEKRLEHEIQYELEGFK